MRTKPPVRHGRRTLTRHALSVSGSLRRARLPEAMLYAEVAKGGSNLSSGERQLLCFARALLQATPILILDEATSNLDSATDDAVQALLRDEFGGRTIITVAHRINTVQKALQAPPKRRLTHDSV